MLFISLQVTKKQVGTNMAKFRKLEYSNVKDRIKSSSNKSAIYVGCDSKLTGTSTLFGLVIVIHIDQHNGGVVFGNKSLISRRMEIGERLMKEVDIAIECAFNIYNSIGERVFEVHLDLNSDPGHKSNKYIKQAVSYVKAQGFECQIKPQAWAASTAADYLIS